MTSARPARIERALWFIESHYGRAISLDEVARICALSRHEMSRAFHRETGMSLSGYLRGRRLTEAARRIAGGDGDILSIALEAGYGSHEAFTRAFRSQFGITPTALRTRGHLNGLMLIDPRRQIMRVSDPRPLRLEARGALSVAGLGERFPVGRFAGIPALWQRFHDHLGYVPGQVGETAYGICTGGFDGSDSYYYLACVEVANLSDITPDLTGLRLPAQRYAVFEHRGHITELAGAVIRILTEWLPASGHRPGDMPSFIERYDAAFDPWTGWGGLQILVPVRD